MKYWLLAHREGRLVEFCWFEAHRLFRRLSAYCWNRYVRMNLDRHKRGIEEWDL